jgi:hypothetical protein
MGGLVFHAVIPYVASDQGFPNCLQCHTVTAGTVLGAVTVDISVRRSAAPGHAIAVVMISACGPDCGADRAVAVARRMMNPLSQTARAVREVTSQRGGR